MIKNSSSSFKTQRLSAENFRKQVKKDWVQLWSQRFHDEKKAEGVSTKNYRRLHVEKGQILYDTRQKKQIDFNEILEKNLGIDYRNMILPTPETGGWRKFAKKNFQKQSPLREEHTIRPDFSQQQRKGGKGWLNKARKRKKIKERQDKTY